MIYIPHINMVAAVRGAARTLRVPQRGGVTVVLVQRRERTAPGAGVPLCLLAVAVLRYMLIILEPGQNVQIG